MLSGFFADYPRRNITKSLAVIRRCSDTNTLDIYLAKWFIDQSKAHVSLPQKPGFSMGLSYYPL